jgi:hypothetical protein
MNLRKNIAWFCFLNRILRRIFAEKRKEIRVEKITVEEDKVA